MAQNVQKTMLVLGTNAGQADLIRHIKAIGWRVVACAHRKGDSGEALADEFHLVNIVDHDAVADLAREVKADLVYSVSSDVAMVSAVAVSEMLNLPHFFDSKLVEMLNQKQLLRRYLNANQLGTVDFMTVARADEANDWPHFPCMVKPTDSQGQRGVKKVENKEGLKEAVEQAIAASITDQAIIEEYLDGVEMSCNVLVQNGKIVCDVLSERLVHGGALTGIPQGHLVPCVNVNNAMQREALQLVHDTVKSLNIQHGPLYFQMMATAKGVRMIEIAPRLDGCHMWRLIELATGTDFLATTIRCLLGEAAMAARPTVKDGEYFELMFQQTPPDKAFQPDNFPVPEDTAYHEYRYQAGAAITPINGRLEVAGYYVRQYDDPEKYRHG